MKRFSMNRRLIIDELQRKLDTLDETHEDYKMYKSMIICSKNLNIQVQTTTQAKEDQLLEMFGM